MLKHFMAGLLLIAMQFPAFANWREDLGTLRIGILAGDDVTRSIAFVEPFRLAIQERLNIDVEIYGARDYASLVQAHTTGRVEYAILSASGYAASHKLCSCVEPLVVAKSSDGNLNFKSVLIARAGGIKSIADLDKIKIVGLSKDSIGGYAFAKFELATDGIKLPEATMIFGKTPRDSVQKFADGIGDVLIGWSSLEGNENDGYSRGNLRDLADKNNGDASPYDVIWQSTPIPHRVHSIVKKLPAEAKDAIKDLLSSLYENDPTAYDAIEPVFGGGFGTISHRAFQPLIRFVSAP